MQVIPTMMEFPAAGAGSVNVGTRSVVVSVGLACTMLMPCAPPVARIHTHVAGCPATRRAAARGGAARRTGRAPGTASAARATPAAARGAAGATRSAGRASGAAPGTLRFEVVAPQARGRQSSAPIHPKLARMRPILAQLRAQSNHRRHGGANFWKSSHMRWLALMSVLDCPNGK